MQEDHDVPVQIRDPEDPPPSAAPRPGPGGAGNSEVEGRKKRSDAGLPRRRSLLLSRAASARFVRVAACLPGGEEELVRVLEPWLDRLVQGELAIVGCEAGRNLEEIVIAYQRERMKGGGDES